MLEHFRQSGEGLDNGLPFLRTEPLKHLEGVRLDWKGHIPNQIFARLGNGNAHHASVMETPGPADQALALQRSMMPVTVLELAIT